MYCVVLYSIRVRSLGKKGVEETLTTTVTRIEAKLVAIHIDACRARRVLGEQQREAEPLIIEVCCRRAG